MTYVSRNIIQGAHPIPAPRRLTFYVQAGRVRDQLIFQLAAKTEEHVAVPFITFLRKLGPTKLDRFQYIEFDLAEYNTLISVSTANPSNGSFHYTIEHLQDSPPDYLKASSWLEWLGLKS
jgi:hypothetical protein